MIYSLLLEGAVTVPAHCLLVSSSLAICALTLLQVVAPSDGTVIRSFRSSLCYINAILTDAVERGLGEGAQTVCKHFSDRFEVGEIFACSSHFFLVVNVLFSALDSIFHSSLVFTSRA